MIYRFFMTLDFSNFKMAYCRKFKGHIKMPDAILNIFVHLITSCMHLPGERKNDEHWICASGDTVSIKSQSV